jgi:hypothetical protein
MVSIIILLKDNYNCYCHDYVFTVLAPDFISGYLKFIVMIYPSGDLWRTVRAGVILSACEESPGIRNSQCRTDHVVIQRVKSFTVHCFQPFSCTFESKSTKTFGPDRQTSTTSKMWEFCHRDKLLNILSVEASTHFEKSCHSERMRLPGV